MWIAILCYQKPGRLVVPVVRSHGRGKVGSWLRVGIDRSNSNSGKSQEDNTP